jgi:hypothetical protein
MNLLDWAQVALSGSDAHRALIALSRRQALATTPVASFGVGLLHWGSEGSAVEGPLLDRVERSRRWWGYWWCLEH